MKITVIQDEVDKFWTKYIDNFEYGTMSQKRAALEVMVAKIVMCASSSTDILKNSEDILEAHY